MADSELKEIQPRCFITRCVWCIDRTTRYSSTSCWFSKIFIYFLFIFLFLFLLEERVTEFFLHPVGLLYSKIEFHKLIYMWLFDRVKNFFSRKKKNSKHWLKEWLQFEFLLLVHHKHSYCYKLSYNSEKNKRYKNKINLTNFLFFFFHSFITRVKSIPPKYTPPPLTALFPTILVLLIVNLDTLPPYTPPLNFKIFIYFKTNNKQINLQKVFLQYYFDQKLLDCHEYALNFEFVFYKIITIKTRTFFQKNYWVV